MLISEPARDDNIHGKSEAQDDNYDGRRRRDGLMSENDGQADPTYPWQRFWVLRDGSIDLSDGGFLRDPQSEFARYSPSKLDTLRDLQQFRALGLLGNRASENQPRLRLNSKHCSDKLRTTAASTSTSIYDHSYRRFSFIRRVFQSAEFTAWEAGNSRSRPSPGQPRRSPSAHRQRCCPPRGRAAPASHSEDVDPHRLPHGRCPMIRRCAAASMIF